MRNAWHETFLLEWTYCLFSILCIRHTAVDANIFVFTDRKDNQFPKIRV